MGRMVRRDHINRPVSQALFNSLNIIPCSKRWVHFSQGVKSAHGFFYFETLNTPGSFVYLDGIKDAASGKDYFYFEVPFANK